MKTRREGNLVTGEMHPQATEHLGLWQTPEARRGKTPLEPAEREHGLPTSWFWTSSPQNSSHFCCFKSPNFWYFAMAALEQIQPVALTLDQSCLDSGAIGIHTLLVMGMGKQKNSISKESKRQIETQKKQNIKKAQFDCYLILCLISS